MDASGFAPIAVPTQRRSLLRDRLWLPLALGTAAFVADVFTARGTGGEFLFVVALLTAYWVRAPHAALFAAAAFTPLLVLGHVLSPPGGTPAAAALFSRALALALVWAVACILVRRARGEARLEALFNQASAGFAITDLTGRFVRVNQCYCGIIGRSAEELLGLRMREITHPEDLPANEALFERLAQEGTPFSIEKRYLRPDGSVVWVHDEVYALRGAGGASEAIIAVGVDITERKRAEERLRESVRFVRRVLDKLFAFVGVLTPDGTLIEGNRAPLEAAGLSSADVIGRKFWDCHWWSYSSEVQKQLEAAVERARAGETVRFDVPLRLAGEQRMWMDFQIAPLRDARGCITHLIPSATDLTARKRAEERLRESEMRYRRLLEVLPVALYSCDAEGRIDYFNERAAEIWGRKPELGDSDERFCGAYRLYRADGAPLAHDQTPMAAALREEVSARGKDMTLERPDGSRVDVQVNIDPIRDSEGTIVGAINAFVDVTERKRAEEQRELLVRELSHRVKNTLAVVQSVAAQTRRSVGSPEQFHEAFAARLQALARTHDLLLLERWQPIALRRLIEQTLTPYLCVDPQRISLSGLPVMIEAQTAVSLAMAVHELATNAAKYGSLSRGSGEVRVSWQPAADAGRPLVDLLWREHGGPPVSAPRRTGFGSRLIQSLSRELGKEIVLAFEPAGLECHMCVPLAHASAAALTGVAAEDSPPTGAGARG